MWRWLSLALALATPATAQDMRGHGGPVRALSVAGDRVISGSFDTRAIRWEGVLPAQVVRGHTGAVTAVLALPEGFATGGQDGQVVIWGTGPEPLASRPVHDAPVAALAATPDGVASGGWDGRIVLPDGTGWEAHQGQVTGLAAFQGGLASTGTDLRLRFWQADNLTGSVDMPSPPAALVATGDTVIVAGADGVLRRVAPNGVVMERSLSERPLPVVALAAGPGLLAAASVSGEVWLVDADDFTLRVRIETGQGAIWALAFAGDTLLTGGNDGLIRRWRIDGTPLGEGSATPATADDSRGAQVWRACAVCHTLDPDDGNRAGPTLHGILGRRIATAPGYAYSDALHRLDITWTPDTIAALFEQGPEAYTPGSRMPEQRLPDPADRAALVEYLRANGG
ncbi:MAG: c-type cytochrome [Gemmobacter sp.]